MSRDVRTPSPTPLQQSLAGGGGGQQQQQQQQQSGSSFFLRERERLVGEIAESLGQILNHSNALNRKLEESITVGKEFEPVAALWSRFGELIQSSGLPFPQQQEYQQQYEQGNVDSAATASEQDRRQMEGREDVAANKRKSIPASSGVPQGEAGMPPGVAPGGGNWASASTNQ